ncbi:hypothetical protein [Pedobacter sandarakinus]|uniref:hypothetical protein n=1 Tax=Pedobacter sandarakinus TaxID=353156 RepID=UPI0022463BEF|nr:hypothetical protein [Pedobacter sandarakinus]MCX2575271.1 hypothetical protein [Pedobacter sandarakinus]
MEQVLSWRKGLFDSNYQVFEHSLLKFSINFNTFTNTAFATTKGAIFSLKSEGYTKPETKILDETNEIIGTIQYEWLNFKARIFLKNGETFEWSFQNSWLSRWSINNHTDQQIIYNSSTSNGLIHSNVENELLIIVGLFIKEYYSRLLVAFMLLVTVLFTSRSIF